MSTLFAWLSDVCCRCVMMYSAEGGDEERRWLGLGALGSTVENVHRKISDCDVFKFSLFSFNVYCVKILTSMNEVSYNNSYCDYCD